MHGFPKTIATRGDIAHLLGTPEYRAHVVAYLQALLDERYNWMLRGALADGEAGDTTTGHKVVEVKDLASGAVTGRYQYDWGLLPVSGLTRLGVTPEEAVRWGCSDRVIPAPATTT